MGKIIASYLMKVHLHEDDAESENPVDVEPTNDQVKQAVVAGLQSELQLEVTVSLIERTDAD